MQYPAELKYTKEHAWVRATAEGATIGVTDFAQKQLGDIIFVELPKSGTALEAGRPYGVVESVKSVSDLLAPVGGTVRRVNEVLVSTPEAINKDPYGGGWIAEVALADAAQLGGLLTAAEYERHLGEASR